MPSYTETCGRLALTSPLGYWPYSISLAYDRTWANFTHRPK